MSDTTTHPPDAELRMHLVHNDNSEMGTFGPKFRDRSRPSLDKVRIQKIAERGSRVTVKAILFHSELVEAEEVLTANMELQGSEAILISELDKQEYQVFIYGITASFQSVGHSDPSIHYRATYKIELERTA